MGLAIDGCNCTCLRRAMRRVSQLYDSKLAPIGLRATQLGILSVVRELGQGSIHELADHLDMDRTTMGKNLRVLEKRRLVSLSTGAGDERSRTVSLTDEGRAVHTAGRALWREAHERFEQENGPETAAALRTLLLNLKT